MKTSSTLRRLLRLRALEEEQSRMLLEAAEAEVKRLESALASVRQSEHQGRELVTRSVQDREPSDRIAGVEQIRACGQAADWIAGRTPQVEAEARAQRSDFVEKRIQRRQVESLHTAGVSQSRFREEKRMQQAQDEWHRMRLQSADSAAAAPAKGDGTWEQSMEKPRKSGL
jgi:flagellar biosynthesis chaperone FliJ